VVSFCVREEEGRVTDKLTLENGTTITLTEDQGELFIGVVNDCPLCEAGHEASPAVPGPEAVQELQAVVMLFDRRLDPPQVERLRAAMRDTVDVIEADGHPIGKRMVRKLEIIA
jgi:hypothetical protein